MSFILFLSQGVVCVLLDYVVKFSASLDSDQDELIIMSCKALIRVARGNKDVRTVYWNEGISKIEMNGQCTVGEGSGVCKIWWLASS